VRASQTRLKLDAPRLAVCAGAHEAGACVRQRTELRRARAYADLVTLGTILLIILVLMLIGAIPRWSHSRSWGYGPSGGLGLVLVVVVALLLMGRL